MASVSLAISSAATQLGYTRVKPCQESAVKAFVTGKDVFLSLPTGYGKSFCYCCLPLIFDILKGKQHPFHVVIVISPLLALMKDQVKKLSDRKIGAVQIHDKFDSCEDDVKSRINTDCSLIFTSPELILGDKSWLDVFRSPVFSKRLVGLVVDEAHCIKKWYGTLLFLSCMHI